MCEREDAVTLKIPVHIDVDKGERSISCDACIVVVIKLLWERDIQTLGCCCGHGAKPSLIVHECYKSLSIAYIREIIAKVDDRPWLIYQWRLVQV